MLKTKVKNREVTFCNIDQFVETRKEIHTHLTSYTSETENLDFLFFFVGDFGQDPKAGRVEAVVKCNRLCLTEDSWRGGGTWGSSLGWPAGSHSGRQAEAERRWYTENTIMRQDSQNKHTLT